METFKINGTSVANGSELGTYIMPPLRRYRSNNRAGRRFSKGRTLSLIDMIRMCDTKDMEYDTYEVHDHALQASSFMREKLMGVDSPLSDLILTQGREFIGKPRLPETRQHRETVLKCLCRIPLLKCIGSRKEFMQLEMGIERRVTNSGFVCPTLAELDKHLDTGLKYSDHVLIERGIVTESYISIYYGRTYSNFNN